MPIEEDLQRFEKVHHRDFPRALQEIRAGKKISHWMWYIFPQVKGLGLSETALYYSIKDINEAQSFLSHPVLGQNIIAITSELLYLSTNNATAVFGKPDDMKLRSSMTLFSLVPHADPIFQKVLDKYFHGELDTRTVALLRGSTSQA